MNIEKIFAILIELLEEQEGVKIEYTLEEKEPAEKSA